MTAQNESDSETEVQLDSGEYATITDCLHYVETALLDGEPPFDPDEMDEETREEWLEDISAAERAIDPYATD